MKIQLLAFLALNLAGCATLENWQSKPAVQFAETEAIKLAASYFSNGGSVDSAWGISTGLNAVSDIVTFAQQQKAPQTAAQAVHDFAANQTAVNGLATGVANIVTSSGAKNPAETAKVIQAIAGGIQVAAASVQ